MANLTITSFYARKAIFWGIVGLIGFIVVKGALLMSVSIWKQLNPPTPSKPDMLFGQLPALNFPASDIKLPDKFTYKLETIEGGLPTLPDVGKVYYMPKLKPNLLSLDRANQKASKMGFKSTPEAIDKSSYKWTNLQNPPTTLEMNINNGNFSFRYPYETDQELLQSKNLPTNDQAAQEAKSFLSSNGLLTDDLATGSAEISYYKYDPPLLVSAPSLSEADFDRIVFLRSPLDNLKILPPDPKVGLVSFLFSGSRDTVKRIVEAKYTYFSIERQTFGTYYLKSVTQAWQELQGGNCYIAHLGQNSDGNITIRRVYLAYYDSFSPQNFLQLIFVFEGDRDFYGYVPAILAK